MRSLVDYKKKKKKKKEKRREKKRGKKIRWISNDGFPSIKMVNYWNDIKFHFEIASFVSSRDR